MADIININKSILPNAMFPSIIGVVEKIAGYDLNVGPIGDAITIFSKKIEAPIADIIKYKNGAFLFLSGLYTIFSMLTANNPVPTADKINATKNGTLNNVRQKYPIYAPIIITPPWAKLEKFIILYTSEYPTDIKAYTLPKDKPLITCCKK